MFSSSVKEIEENSLELQCRHFALRKVVSFFFRKGIMERIKILKIAEESDIVIFSPQRSEGLK